MNKEQTEAAALALASTKARLIQDWSTDKLCQEQIASLPSDCVREALDTMINFTTAALTDSMKCRSHGNDHTVSLIESAITSLHLRIDT